MRQTICIVGATGALGRETARRFAQSGWKVGLGGRSMDRLELLAQELRTSAAGPIVPALCPSGDSVAVSMAFDRWEEEFGAPRACFYLAGGFRGGRRANEWDAEDWREMLDMNLIGAAVTLAEGFGRMVRAGGGGVLLAVGSAAGLDATPGVAPYAVSKAGLAHLVRVLAVEGEAEGIRAHLLVPGTLDTEANRAAMPDADRSRWTSLAAAAEALFWLASEDAMAVTRAVLRL